MLYTNVDHQPAVLILYKICYFLAECKDEAGELAQAQEEPGKQMG